MHSETDYCESQLSLNLTNRNILPDGSGPIRRKHKNPFLVIFYIYSITIVIFLSSNECAKKINLLPSSWFVYRVLNGLLYLSNAVYDKFINLISYQMYAKRKLIKKEIQI